MSEPLDSAGTFKSKYGRIVLVLLFLCGVAIYIGHSDARKEKLRGDVSSFSLAASKVLFSGEDPYDRAQVNHNYKYFPTNAIIIYPLTLVSVYTAQGIWFALNLGLIIWAFASLRAMLKPIHIPWWVFVLTLVVVFRLMVMNLRLGQWNTSVFCLSLIGMHLLSEKRLVAGGGFLSLAIVLKFMPAMLLLYLFAQRRWKAIGITVAGLLFWIFVLPAIAVGPSRTIELLTEFRSNSTERVQKITNDEEIGSLSFNSNIFRAMSPVKIEIKDVHYSVNAFGLPRDQGSQVTNWICGALAAAFAVWLIIASKDSERINLYGHLVLIGLCYMAWYALAPGVRHAQLIGITPLTFSLFAGLVIARDKRTRMTVAFGTALLFAMYTTPSEIVKGTVYNRVAEASGIIGYALVFHIFLGIYVFYKLGKDQKATWLMRFKVLRSMQDKLMCKCDSMFQVAEPED